MTSEGHTSSDQDRDPEITEALQALWPYEVWESFVNEGPLTWQEAQRSAGIICRTLKKPYGRESSARHHSFREFMEKIFGENWQEVATASSRARELQERDEAPVSSLQPPEGFGPPPTSTQTLTSHAEAGGAKGARSRQQQEQALLEAMQSVLRQFAADVSGSTAEESSAASGS